jgi:hypothetical protein
MSPSENKLHGQPEHAQSFIHEALREILFNILMIPAYEVKRTVVKF